MKKIKLTKGKFALVDDEDFEHLKKWEWGYYGGYAARKEYLGKKGGKEIIRNVQMTREILGPHPFSRVGHINGNKLDCRKENLSETINYKYLGMQKKRFVDKGKRTTSRFKGVSFHSQTEKWIAQRGGYLGSFDKEEDAARAHDIAAILMYGKFAMTNKRMGLL